MSAYPASTEQSLKALLEFEEAGIAPLRVRLAERLGHAVPTVSQSVAKLEATGLVSLSSGDRRILLTPAGRAIAVAVLRRHRLAEAFLHRVIGLDWHRLHDEADRWEHSMGDEVADLLDEQLGHPEHTPYGTPIPPDDPKWRAPRWAPRVRALDTLIAAAGRPGGAVEGAGIDASTRIGCRLEWIGELGQASPQALDLLGRLGIRPGSEFTATTTDRGIELRTPAGDRGVLPPSARDRIFITATPPTACADAGTTTRPATGRRIGARQARER